MFSLSHTTYMFMEYGRISCRHSSFIILKVERFELLFLVILRSQQTHFCQAYPFMKELNHQWPANQGCMAGKEQSVILSWLAWRGSDTRSTSYKDVLGLWWTHTGNCCGFDRLIFFVGMKLWVWDNNVIADWHLEFKLVMLRQKCSGRSQAISMQHAANCKTELIFGSWRGSSDVLNQCIETLTFCI